MGGREALQINAGSTHQRAETSQCPPPRAWLRGLLWAGPPGSGGKHSARPILLLGLVTERQPSGHFFLDALCVLGGAGTKEKVPWPLWKGLRMGVPKRCWGGHSPRLYKSKGKLYLVFVHPPWELPLVPCPLGQSCDLPAFLESCLLLLRLPRA